MSLFYALNNTTMMNKIVLVSCVTLFIGLNLEDVHLN